MAHALDTVAVTKCMEDSWVSPEGKDSLDKLPNSLLKQEISDAKDYGVLKLPEAVVNGVILRGQTGYGATLELNVAQAICNGRLRICSFFHTHLLTLSSSLCFFMEKLSFTNMVHSFFFFFFASFQVLRNIQKHVMILLRELCNYISISETCFYFLLFLHGAASKVKGGLRTDS